MIFLSITIFTIRLITSSSLNSLKPVRYLISKWVSLFRNLERVKISLSKSGVYSLNLARIFSFFEGVFAKLAKFSFLAGGGTGDLSHCRKVAVIDQKMANDLSR